MISYDECVELSQKIYEELNRKGAGLGNMSSSIIARVIIDYFSDKKASNKALDEALNE